MLRSTIIIVAVALALAGCGGGGGATATPSPIPGGNVQGYPADVPLDGPAQATPDSLPTVPGYP
jgi:hypothetical protein